MSYILKDSNENPILRNEKEIYVQDVIGTVKGVNLEKRTLTIIGTDETRDRDGDIIRVNGWILENYLKNPVFLWAHNYSSVPLGATSQLVRRRNPGRLEFKDIRFPTEGLNPFADMILHLFNEKIINASSVGFLPYKWKELEKSENADEEPPMWKWGREFTKQELLELSGCPVPSNPSALQNFVKNFAGSEILTQNLINCFNSGGIEELPAKDDILEELNVKGEIDIVDEDRPVQVQVPGQLEIESEDEAEMKDASVSPSVEPDEEEESIAPEKEVEVVEVKESEEEIIDVEKEIPEEVRETKQVFSLSQEDKEWIAQTIKEAVQSNREESPSVVLPKITFEEPQKSSEEDITAFQEALGKLKKVADEIKEVVENATH